MKYLLVNTVSGAEKNLNGTATDPRWCTAGRNGPPCRRRSRCTRTPHRRTYNCPGLRRFREGRHRDVRERQLRARRRRADRAGDRAPSHADLVVTAVARPASERPAERRASPSRADRGEPGHRPGARVDDQLLSREHEHRDAKKNLEGRSGRRRRSTRAQAPRPVGDADALLGHSCPARTALQACADGPKGVSEDVRERTTVTNAAGTMTVRAGAQPRGQLAHEPARHAPRSARSSTITNSVRNTGSVVAGGQRHEVLPGLDPRTGRSRT